MSIKIDLANQIRQTSVPAWKPLIPLFEAVMNSLQAIKDANLPPSVVGRVVINVEREATLLEQDTARIVGFKIEDNGIGLDDENFDAFNTAYSSHKLTSGGKGLGRFTWLKAFRLAKIESTFDPGNGELLTRSFTFDEHYDLDERGIPQPPKSTSTGTTVHLIDLRQQYIDQLPRSGEAVVQKLIEHFILILLQQDCPRITVRDVGSTYAVNDVFDKDYRATSSTYEFRIGNEVFTLNGFRLPTSRSTKHKLLYAADQRAVTSDNLADFLPNLGTRLDDSNGTPFFYLAIVQSPYLSQHVNANRTDFDFGSADADLQLDLVPTNLIPRVEIRNAALPLVEEDLKAVIERINAAKYEKIKHYVLTEAPQYRILLKYANEFLGKLPPEPTRPQMEAVLHRELFDREVDLKRESTRIIKEAGKIEDYEGYHQRLTDFLDRYNELGVSALAQYVAHRKIILELLERAISLTEGKGQYPLESVVHQLVFPMRHTSEELPYSEQNLWLIDERLTYHSLITSDKRLDSTPLLSSESARRGDIVIFDEKIIFADVRADEHPINSITTIEFKRPGRDDYSDSENPVRQAFRLIDDIRKSKFKYKGRPVSVANDAIPATAYCICDITESLREALLAMDAFVTPDNQGYYGFHRNYRIYFEVMDYNKMLRDAKKRNRIFFDKLNLVDNR